MPSNNPAFGRGFARSGSGQVAGWGAQPQYGAPGQYGAPTQQDPYAAPSPYAATTTRYMTMDDVVTKTGLSFLVTVIAAAAVWAAPGYAAFSFALPALMIAFILGMVISFKQIANPAATLAYAALEGVFLGAISEAFNARWPGVVTQAVIGTFGVFAGMLIVYKTGAIRVTPKFTRGILAALVGVLVLMLANGIAYFFTPGGLGLRTGGPLAIVFSLVVIGVAAFSLLVDFDMADEAIRRGAPAKFAWYIAFGLLVTVVWLYLEILRLLSYFRD
ncbi:MAG: Bax inhibitor-1/YccA family membrane protein [Blastococcus sp.]